MICDGSSCLKLGFDRLGFSGKRNEIIVTQCGLEPILPIIRPNQMVTQSSNFMVGPEGHRPSKLSAHFARHACPHHVLTVPRVSRCLVSCAGDHVLCFPTF